MALVVALEPLPPETFGMGSFSCFFGSGVRKAGDRRGGVGRTGGKREGWEGKKRRTREGTGREGKGTYAALQFANQQAVEDLARFVAVADVFEGFGGVLAADVEEDFFAAAVGWGR